MLPGSERKTRGSRDRLPLPVHRRARRGFQDPCPAFRPSRSLNPDPPVRECRIHEKSAGSPAIPSQPASQPLSNKLTQSIRIEGFFQPGIRNRVQEFSRALRKGATRQEDHSLRTLGPNSKKFVV